MDSVSEYGMKEIRSLTKKANED